ncbi:hypothetical protein NDA18_004487 [Ustilago nuda]|nr:hypothetical protein NDA18_004487 [Ustilago nuda]
MSQNIASRRIPLRTRSTASSIGAQAKENASLTSRSTRYDPADAGPSKPSSTLTAATKASAASGVLGTRKRAALGDLTNANRTRPTMTGNGDKGKTALKDAINPRATTSSRSAAVTVTATATTSTTTTTGVGAARRVVPTRPTTTTSTTAGDAAAAAAADQPFRASRRLAGTTTTTASKTSGIPSASSRSNSTTAAFAARKGTMSRTASGNSQTGLGREASTTSVASTKLNEAIVDTGDKMEAPQAKRLKTEQKPAKDEGWEDLDAEDAEDPLMVAEYVNDIFEYMKELEIINMPNGDYMSLQEEINWDVRAILIDWLVDVHTKFRLLPETLYLAVNIIDRFLSRRTISLSKLQLVGVTAMFIASKYEEVMCPSIKNFYHIADGGYTDVEILRAERYVLKVLDFSMSYANPMNFLRRISKADNYDIQTRTVAKYFMEISLLDYRLMEHPPSLIAAAAAWLAREVLERGEWTPTLVHYSTYSEQELLGTAEIMLDYCLRPITHQFFHKKYAHKKFMRASTYVVDWARKSFPEGVVAVDEQQDLNVLRVDLYDRKGVERPEQSVVSTSSGANTPAPAVAGFDAKPSQNEDVDADETYDYPQEDDEEQEEDEGETEELDEEELLDEVKAGAAQRRQYTRQVLRDVTNAYEATETF